jgi:perosamine synthetase
VIDLAPWPQPATPAIRVAEPETTAAEVAAVTAALARNWVGPDGIDARRVEAELSDAFGPGAHALLVANGSVALVLALHALGIGPGDEVIVPALTYAATASSIVHVGATPVFCDVDARTWGLSPATVTPALTPRTRAVIAVHLYGVPCDITAVRDLCATEGLALIEDSAECLLGAVGGRVCGTFGAVGTLSFFANKLLTAGEGGAVVTTDAHLARRLALLRGQGMDPDRRYVFLEPGFNFRMSGLQAAYLSAQWDRRAAITAHRAAVESVYARSLGDLVVRPEPPPGGTRVPWLFTARFARTDAGHARRVAAALAGDGIETRPVFRPLPALPAFARYPVVGSDVATGIAATGISLPTSAAVTDDDATRIAALVRAVA